MKLLEEIEQYRALGTVEELKEARELFEKTKIVGAENIIIICKDGTYEVDGIDVLEAIQKQIPKKPNFEQKGLFGVKMWHCPVCNKEIISDWNKDFANNYCHHCGQRILKDNNNEIETPEVSELPKLSKRERIVCELLGTGWITRDECLGCLIYQNKKPYKYYEKGMWLHEEKSGLVVESLKWLGVNLDFIRWEDEKPWRVEDLLKLEVQDE